MSFPPGFSSSLRCLDSRAACRSLASLAASLAPMAGVVPPRASSPLRTNETTQPRMGTRALPHKSEALRNVINQKIFPGASST